MLSPFHIRTARAALEISQIELAKSTDLAIKTVQKMEYGFDEFVNVNARSLIKVKRFFEERGIEFIEATNDGSIAGVGIRFFPPERDL